MNKKKLKIGLHLFIAVILTLGFSISTQSLLAQWVAPSDSPPQCNSTDPGCYEILNTSINSQTKSGPLEVGSIGATFGGVIGGGLTVTGATSITGNVDVTGGITAANNICSSGGSVCLNSISSDYYTKTDLNTPGTINTAGNPVQWTRLIGVPVSIADGSDDDTLYTAGNGISLSGQQFTVTGGNGLSQTSSGLRIDSAACGANEYSTWDGNQWLCRTDQNVATAYSAGNGIGLSGTTFSVSGGNGLSQTATGLQTDAITCGVNQYSYWNGSSWQCRNDQDTDTNTTYSAGNGIGLSGTAFSVSSGNGLSQTATGLAISAATCGAGQYSYWTGTQWLCRSDQTGSSYGSWRLYRNGSNIDYISSGEVLGFDNSGSINVVWDGSRDLSFAANESYLQRRISNTCPSGQYAYSVSQTGTLNCRADQTGTAGISDVVAGNGLTRTSSGNVITMHVGGGTGISVAANGISVSDIYVRNSGDYLTGSLNMGGHNITNVSTLQAHYLDDSDHVIGVNADLNFNNTRRVRGLKNPPPSTSDATSKAYVDGRRNTWSNMPAGTLCGIYLVTQGVVHANRPCNGSSISSRCPSGFSRADLGYFEAGNGTRKWVTCVKN